MSSTQAPDRVRVEIIFTFFKDDRDKWRWRSGSLNRQHAISAAGFCDYSTALRAAKNQAALYSGPTIIKEPPKILRMRQARDALTDADSVAAVFGLSRPNQQSFQGVNA